MAYLMPIDRRTRKAGLKVVLQEKHDEDQQKRLRISFQEMPYYTESDYDSEDGSEASFNCSEISDDSIALTITSQCWLKIQYVDHVFPIHKQACH